MKNKGLNNIVILILTFLNPIVAMADFQLKLSGMKGTAIYGMILGILDFLQKCASLCFLLALGFLIISFQNTDGNKKLSALKIFGIGIMLFGLKPIFLLTFS